MTTNIIKDSPGAIQRRHGALPAPLAMSRLSQLAGFVTDFVGLLEQGRRDIGPTFTLDILGSEPQVVFTDEASLIDIVSGSREHFGHANDMLVAVTGRQSMFVLDGEPHRESRRRTLSAFATERMRIQGKMMKDTVDAWLDTIADGQRISASSAAADLMMNIILDAIFGAASNQDDKQLRHVVAKFAEPADSRLAIGIALMIPGLTLRQLLLGGRDPQTLALLAKSSAILDWLPWRRRMKELVESLVTQIRRRRESIDSGGNDILTHLLRNARDEGTVYPDGVAFDELMTLIFAGYQSSSITLAWTLYRLASAPAAVQRLREELDEAFPNRPIDSSQLEQLPFLCAVINETLRLDGVGIGLYRRLLRERRIGGYDLPAGTQVFGYTYPQHRNPSKWEYPDEFRPEQFMGKQLKQHEFAPFGAGYRRCIGAGFAMYSLRVALAQTVRRADWELPNGVTVKRGMRGTLVGPVGPVPLKMIRVRPRANG